MANLIKHAPDLLVAPLVKSHFEPCVGLAFTQLAHLGWGGALTFLDDNASSQSLNGLIGRHTFDFSPVNFRNPILPRGNYIGQFTASGPQQQTFAVQVQATDSM